MLTIGIAAHNESRSIGAALRTVIASARASGEPWEVVVVASGCTDATVDCARAALTNTENARVVVEDSRSGKVSALNTIFKVARGNVVVLCDADVTVSLNSISEFRKAFASNPQLCLAYARVATVAGPSRFWSGVGERSAAALHAYRSLPNGYGRWLVCGHLYSLRSDAWPNPPESVVVDDAFVGAHIAGVSKEAIRYLSDAMAYVRYPQNLSDYLAQKMRNRLGRRQLAEHLQRAPVPARWVGLDYLRQAGIHGIPHVPIVVLDSVLVAASETAWLLGRRQSRLWKLVQSSKIQGEA